MADIPDNAPTGPHDLEVVHRYWDGSAWQDEPIDTPFVGELTILSDIGTPTPGQGVGPFNNPEFFDYPLVLPDPRLEISLTMTNPPNVPLALHFPLLPSLAGTKDFGYRGKHAWLTKLEVVQRRQRRQCRCQRRR